MRFISLFLFFPLFVSAQQQLTQTIRGVVREKSTMQVLPAAQISITADGQQMHTLSNEKGEFSISDIPVGRCNIMVSMLGFRAYAANNVLVYSGKEVVLEIVMEEDVHALQNIVVTPKTEKEQPLNQLAVVSARMLSSEEANRYAGSFGGDPARMTAGFAGVVAANDTRNDIIIRGNSPMGLLWRLDGFDIPNPNHFGVMGGTGGPIGMINNNQLSNSDFYTGAFPAEFGNATSGVFDLRLRSGNNQKHEFMASMGMNGFELGAEGPLNRKTRASYMINGRYSFLDLAMKLFNIDFSGSGSAAVPQYQDLSAKVNIPLKHGNLSWITLLGKSQIRQEPDFENVSEWLVGERGQDMSMRGSQIFSGVNYTHRFGYATRLENRVSYQLFKSSVTIDQIEYPSMDRFKDVYQSDNREGRFAWSSILNHRINTKNMIRTGVGADLFMTNVYNVGDSVVLNDFRGNTTLLKTFAQWQYRFTNTFSMVPGLYTHYYTLNGDYSIEPRIGFKWEATPRTAFTLGGGLYSQLQPRLVQLYMDEITGERVNENLTMSKSWQIVTGHSQRIGEGLHLKTEVYYQYLFNIPVIPAIPEESILNFGDDFDNEWDYLFVNEGKGRNYGVEITLEKFFNKHYYFLISTSLYESKYKGYDNRERNTKFAGNFALNGLFGYEWKMGTRTLFSTNLKVSYAGGKRYVPMRMTAITDGSSDNDYEFDYSQAYTNKVADYFRLDININMKQNYKRWASEWFAEINNVTNHKNIWMKYYDVSRNKEIVVYQYGFMPMGGLRIYF
ncbi:MAG: TonB-dependent receptor [Bacteroidales bacterium]|jgi:hypothetical protein|nr:TonB-dependent receptor [Bacteroidales bacterium]